MKVCLKINIPARYLKVPNNMFPVSKSLDCEFHGNLEAAAAEFQLYFHATNTTPARELNCLASRVTQFWHQYFPMGCSCRRYDLIFLALTVLCGLPWVLHTKGEVFRKYSSQNWETPLYTITHGSWTVWHQIEPKHKNSGKTFAKLFPSVI